SELETSAIGSGSPARRSKPPFQQDQQGGGNVQAMKILAIVLIVVGLVALAYEGITYTKREKVLEIGPITATKDTKQTIPLSPVLGGAALVCGVVLLIAAARPARRRFPSTSRSRLRRSDVASWTWSDGTIPLAASRPCCARRPARRRTNPPHRAPPGRKSTSRPVESRPYRSISARSSRRRSPGR